MKQKKYQLNTIEMKTIIFISDIGSQKRDYDRFGIDILKKNLM